VKLQPRPPPPQVEDPELRAALKARPEPAGSPILTRPSVWVAAAGAVALAVGAGVGSSVSSFQKRAVDANGDGVLDVTRAELAGAQRNALIANVLMGVGAAAVGAGAIWFFVEPAPPASPVGSASSGGLVLGAGGVF
jgi:hypothetical protein